MVQAMVDQWRKLDAEYAAAHQEYLRMRQAREQETARPAPVAEGFNARLAAKSNLARAQRTMHEFCQKHTDFLMAMREG